MYNRNHRRQTTPSPNGGGPITPPSTPLSDKGPSYRGNSPNFSPHRGNGWNNPSQFPSLDDQNLGSPQHFLNAALIGIRNPYMILQEPETNDWTCFCSRTIFWHELVKMIHGIKYFLRICSHGIIWKRHNYISKIWNAISWLETIQQLNRILFFAGMENTHYTTVYNNSSENKVTTR